MTSINGEQLTSSELMTFIPTPSYLGDPKVYFASTTVGKSKVSSEHIDSVTFIFTDARGVHVLSLEYFIVTLLIHARAPVPKEGHINLFKV